LLQSFQVCNDLGSVGLRVDADVFLGDLTIGIDDKRVALGADVFAAHEFLGLPATVGFYNFVLRVAQQRKIQVILVEEFLMRPGRIFADADNFAIAELSDDFAGVAEIAGLGRAAGRVVFRVEIQH